MSNELWLWGSANYSQLANPNDAALKNLRRPEMESVSFPSPLVDVSGSRNFAAAVTVDGIVYVWGQNSYGVIDIDSDFKKQFVEPQPQQNLSDKNIHVVQVSCGLHFIVVLSSDGNIYSWGCNANSQTGSGYKAQYHAPLPVRLPDQDGAVDIVKVVAGANHSLALTRHGNVYGWGLNRYFQATGGTVPSGIASTAFTEAKTPHLLTAFRDTLIIDIATREHANAALSATGVVYTWGYNGRGATGHTLGRLTPSDRDSSGVDREEWAVAVTALPISKSVPMEKIEMGCSWGFCIAAQSHALYGWGKGPRYAASKKRRFADVLNKLAFDPLLQKKDKSKKSKKAKKMNPGRTKYYQPGYGRREEDKDPSQAEPKCITTQKVKNVHAGHSHVIIRFEDESNYMLGANRECQCGLQPVDVVEEWLSSSLVLEENVFCGYHFNGTYSAAQAPTNLSGFMSRMLYQSKTNRDIEIIVQKTNSNNDDNNKNNSDETKTITVHSSVIAYRASKWFQNEIYPSKIYSNTNNNNNDEANNSKTTTTSPKYSIKIQVSKFKTLDSFISFLYTGHLSMSLTKRTATELSSLASKFEIPQLEYLCRTVIESLRLSSSKSSQSLKELREKFSEQLLSCQDQLHQDLLYALEDVNQTEEGNPRVSPTAVIKTSSGDSMNAHREFLCLASSVIDLSFNHEMQESKTSVIFVEELSDQESLSQFLRHIYTLSSDHILLDYAVELMELGAKLEIPSLENSAREAIVEAMDEETVSDLILLAHRRGRTSLLLHCIKFIVDRISNDKWERMKSLLPDGIIEKIDKRKYG